MIRKAILAIVMVFVYSINQVLPVYAAITPGPEGAGEPSAGTTRFFYSDQVGSTLVVTDNKGTEEARLVRTPYGVLNVDRSSGTDDFRPKYTGFERDSRSSEEDGKLEYDSPATDLISFPARYYSPLLGRFITPDPVMSSTNPYEYAAGNPVANVDPTGEAAVNLPSVYSVGEETTVGGTLSKTLSTSVGEETAVGSTIVEEAVGSTFGPIGILIASLLAAIEIAVESYLLSAPTQAPSGTAPELGSEGGGSYGPVIPSSWTAAGSSRVSMALGSINSPYRYPTRFPVGVGPNLPGLAQLPDAPTSPANFLDSCSSFAAGTQVATSKGLKPIEEVKVGDIVLAYDDEANEKGEYVVGKLLTGVAKSLVAITVEGEEIETTPEHEFYASRGWTKAKDLEIGDSLVSLDGQAATISNFELIQTNTQVYNFEVEQAHTYYVSDQRILVHNPHCIFGNQVRIVVTPLGGFRIVRTISGLLSRLLPNTGSATNQAMRTYVNNAAPVPTLIRSHITYRSDNNVLKTRTIEVWNPPILGSRWDAGHGIGRQNGGPGRTINNIFPQNYEANRFAGLRGGQYTVFHNTTNFHSWRSFEDKIHRKLNKYGIVLQTVELIY
ncbi:MAG: polymorphic toxin-type HINT domain-containing protein [Xenococcaceae cyanobacterium]